MARGKRQEYEAGALSPQSPSGTGTGCSSHGRLFSPFWKLWLLFSVRKTVREKNYAGNTPVKWKQHSILYWGFYSPSKLSCSSGEAATSLSCHDLKAFRWKSIYFLSQRITRIICTVWFSTHWATEQSHAIICILFVLAFFIFFVNISDDNTLCSF